MDRMLRVARWGVMVWAVVCAAIGGRARGADAGAGLPEGVKAVWDVGTAWREGTATRERICVNGLWRWRPVLAGEKLDAAPPAEGWGFFKVPGAWPGVSDYMQKDSQTVH